jgi:hypothetical protein
VTNRLKPSIGRVRLQVLAHGPQDYLGRDAKAPKRPGGVGHEQYFRRDCCREQCSYPGTLPRSMQQIQFPSSLFNDDAQFS